MLNIKRMRMAGNLLADPGDEIVRECLDEIEKLHAELTTLKAAARKILAADGENRWEPFDYMRARVEGA